MGRPKDSKDKQKRQPRVTRNDAELNPLPEELQEADRLLLLSTITRVKEQMVIREASAQRIAQLVGELETIAENFGNGIEVWID